MALGRTLNESTQQLSQGEQKGRPSPLFRLQALNPSDRNKLLSAGYLKLVGIAISI
jgi:hypothetical protein